MRSTFSLLKFSDARFSRATASRHARAVDPSRGPSDTAVSITALRRESPHATLCGVCRTATPPDLVLINVSPESCASLTIRVADGTRNDLNRITMEDAVFATRQEQSLAPAAPKSMNVQG